MFPFMWTLALRKCITYPSTHSPLPRQGPGLELMQPSSRVLPQQQNTTAADVNGQAEASNSSSGNIVLEGNGSFWGRLKGSLGNILGGLGRAVESPPAAQQHLEHHPLQQHPPHHEAVVDTPPPPSHSEGHRRRPDESAPGREDGLSHRHSTPVTEPPRSSAEGEGRGWGVHSIV